MYSAKNNYNLGPLGSYRVDSGVKRDWRPVTFHVLRFTGKTPRNRKQPQITVTGRKHAGETRDGIGYDKPA